MIITSFKIISLFLSTLVSQVTVVEVVEADIVIFPGSGQRAASTLCSLLKQNRLSKDEAGLYMAKVQNALLQSSDNSIVSRFTDTFNQESERNSGCNLALTDQSTKSPY